MRCSHFPGYFRDMSKVPNPLSCNHVTEEIKAHPGRSKGDKEICSSKAPGKLRLMTTTAILFSQHLQGQVSDEFLLDGLGWQMFHPHCWDGTALHAQVTWIRWRTGRGKTHVEEQLSCCSVPKIWLHHLHTANFQLSEKNSSVSKKVSAHRHREPQLLCEELHLKAAFSQPAQVKTFLPLNTTALQTLISLTSSMRHLCSYNII